jgi:CheY-like chemotaxis protein
MFGRLVAAWIKTSLLFAMLKLSCVQLHGATNNNSNFETPPPVPGSIQWDNIQRSTKQRQELYRKRVPIPGAVAADVPRAGGAEFAVSRTMQAAQMQSSPAAAGSFPGFFFFTALFALAGLLVVRIVAPNALDRFNRRLNPWAAAPAMEPVFTEKIRAEEEAFAGFLAEFRVGPAASPRPDTVGKADPSTEFYARTPKLLAAQRTLLQDIGRAPDFLARQKALTDLRLEMASFKGAAGFSEALPVWQVASALEGLLKQLTDKIGNVTPSTLRAVAGGVDLLDSLCAPGLMPGLLAEHPLKFLIVDDDLISRQAMSLALKKAFGQPDLAVDGETALAQAGQQAYDVIFLDVQLPGMDGFELCTKIRDAGLNRATPVVFVTSHSDFEARAKSILTGGNDLMGKPFLTFEITVKALTLALRGRLQSHVQKSLPQTELEDSLVTVTDGTSSVPSSAAATRPLHPAPAATETDEHTNAFLARASTQLEPLRELCRTILQIPDAETRQTMLADGFLRINSLISRNGSAVVHPAYQVGNALEGLFKKMLQDPKHSTPSMLATMASAVDLLNDLCVPGLQADLATNPPVQMLVVDDDLVARRVIVGALQTVFARPESVENGEAALALAREKPFDVIFMDVVMPGMDGFEACSKIRATIPNRATPVVFVTGHGDFETRAEMTRNGGNDLLGKPFLPSEITVKALTFALRGRLQQIKK